MPNKKNDFINPYQEKKSQLLPAKKSENKLIIDALISWKVEDFEKKSRDFKFYAYLYLILLSLTVYGLVTDNLLLSILIILFGFTFFLFEKKEPKIINCAITKNGIFIQDYLHNYDSLKSFWIEYQPKGVKELSFRNNHYLFSYNRIPLGKEINPAKLREQLIKFLPEEEPRWHFNHFLEKL